MQKGISFFIRLLILAVITINLAVGENEIVKRAGAQATDVDLKNYEEFISWINEQN